MVTIYNCIFEPAGRRAERFLEFMADVIAIEVNSNPGPASSYLEINLLAFSQVVELNSTAFIQDPLKQLAHRFAHLLTILYTLDCAVSVGQSIQYLEILQRRFHIGLSLPDILGSLKKSPSPQTTAAFVMRRDPPGGRHDNDHPEISNIQIMPTFAEIASTRTEYLLLKDPRQWHIGGLSVILDRNFRLLREDTIGQLRDVVHTELQHDNLQTSRKNQARTHVYQKATVNSLHLGRFSGMQFLVSFVLELQTSKQPSHAEELREKARVSIEESEKLCSLHPSQTRGLYHEIDGTRSMLKGATFYAQVTNEGRMAVLNTMARELRRTDH